MTDDQKAAAQERLAILTRAQEFRDMTATPGWKQLYALHTEWVEKARTDLRKIDTSNRETTIDALQRWQIAENFIELEANYINHTLAQAEEIRGNLTFEDAILMEQAEHEHEPGRDPAGY